MTFYNNINDLYNHLEDKEDLKRFNMDKEWLELLALLEKINPCNQRYEITDSCLFISYQHKINILNFKKLFPLKLNVVIIGFPISISHKAYFGDAERVKEIVEKRKGFKIILNADKPFDIGGTTLSSFVFHNRFKSFEDYIYALRSSYRRRLMIALSLREGLSIRKMNRVNFSKNHYKLYLSIMKRTQNPLEILPIEFFREYEEEIYEFIDRNTQRIVGFIQVKEIEEKLLFLFGGFERKDNKKYDLYYNMLLKIIEIAIEQNIKVIEFGQTAEESKLKIGCQEMKKYLYLHHSNSLINKFIQKLVGSFSYKAYKIEHKVFKEDTKVEKL